MLTIEQIRAARALLDWSQSDLADHADLSQTGIARIENGTNQPNTKTIEKIMAAFDRADIEFIGDTGLKKRVNEIRVLRGKKGLETLINDIHETALTAKQAGEDVSGFVYLYNARPKNWHKWLGKDWWDNHSKRMSELGQDVQHIITREGDDYFISSSFSEHRGFPMELFNDQSIYAYGSKLAFVSFSEDSVVSHLLDNKNFCDGFRVLFEIAWDNVAKKL